MTFVAFDLDNTLGYFEVVGPLAYFMSPEFLQNPEESLTNPFNISKRLAYKLEHVQKAFAEELLKHPEVLHAILRPNLDSLIKPLLRKKVTVIIYSNTGNTFSTHLAKNMIERKYKSPGLIKLIADVFHPLRKPETTGKRGANGFLNPDKTFPVLERLLQEAAKIQVPIHPERIAFVDDKTPMHPIVESVKDGLTYIKPTPYAPILTRAVRQKILQIALEVIDRAKLLSDNEYLESPFCYRRIRRAEGTTVIKGFPDIFTYVWKAMNNTYYPPQHWSNDTFNLESEMRRFFQQ
jgi:hypothetical protein